MMVNTDKIEKAGINTFSLSDGGELWLYHGGAGRKYPDVVDDEALDKAIEEFKANVPM